MRGYLLPCETEVRMRGRRSLLVALEDHCRYQRATVMALDESAFGALAIVPLGMVTLRA
jgi:hypothetical protein